MLLLRGNQRSTSREILRSKSVRIKVIQDEFVNENDYCLLKSYPMRSILNDAMVHSLPVISNALFSISKYDHVSAATCL